MQCDFKDYIDLVLQDHEVEKYKQEERDNVCMNTSRDVISIRNINNISTSLLLLEEKGNFLACGCDVNITTSDSFLYY